ncbi:MAG: dihydrolipoyl dehydrogenase [Dehalococcoidia bacterium]|nr:dihydrolipoyl dehydrogenase [Dehalococcoidia bacterium]
MADFDVIVIGSGPGGYVAAIRAAQLGLKTAVIERDEIGGVCLNWGCIPTKSLLRNAEVVTLFKHAADYGISAENVRFDFSVAIDRSRRVVTKHVKGIELLFRKNKVALIKGTAKLLGNGRIAVEGGQELSASSIILATGARARSLPMLPINGTSVVTSREALAMKEMPASVAIVGGGPTGCEFASIYSSYGAQVTIVEILPHLLPNEDAEVSEALERAFREQGISCLTKTKVSGARVGNGVQLSLEAADGKQELTVDRVFVSVGIQGNTENIGLGTAGVAVERGFIQVDDLMRTSAPNVYAIGDVTGKLALAHVASAQGVGVVERIAGRQAPPVDYRLMPRAVYCTPQVASWGMTEAEAKQAGQGIKVGKVPMAAVSKATILGESAGFAKVVANAETGEILGAHLVGPEVTELLGELSMTRALEGTVHELGTTVHAHPTLSEMLKEAALAANGEAINI